MNTFSFSPRSGLMRLVAVFLCAALVLSGVPAVFAEESFTLGDADCDGEVTAADARSALRASIGLLDLSGVFEAVDVVKDDRITPADALQIYKLAVEIDTLDGPRAPEDEAGSGASYLLSNRIDGSTVFVTVSVSPADCAESGMFRLLFDRDLFSIDDWERAGNNVFTAYNEETDECAFFLTQPPEDGPAADVIGIALVPVAPIPESGSEITVFPMDTAESVISPGGGTLVVTGESVSPTSGKLEGGLEWSIEDGVLSVTGSGAMPDFSEWDLAAPWQERADEITEVVVGPGVENIGAHAFADLTELAALTLPDSVGYIGDYAFSGCESLPLADIPSGVTDIGDYAFYNCAELTTINLSKGVRSVGSNSFSFDPKLGELKLPASVMNVSGNPVAGCPSLEKIEVAEDNHNYSSAGNCLFDNTRNAVIAGCADSVIPDGTGFIAPEAFLGCVGLAHIDIPSSVAEIGERAFMGSGLESITVPDSVEFLGTCVFSECASLESAALGANIVTVPYSAFSSCSSLAAVDLPDGVVSIGNSAFQDCRALALDALPEGLEEIGTMAFFNCAGLGDIDLPDSLRSIGAEAFAGSSCYFSDSNWVDGVLYLDNWALAHDDTAAITDLSLREGTVGIADDAFYMTPGLASVDIPEGVRFIGDGAFAMCEDLNIIDLPDSLEMMGSWSFGSTGYTNSDENREENGSIYLDGWLISCYDVDDTTFTVKDGTVGIADFAVDLTGSVRLLYLPASLRFAGRQFIFSFRELTDINYDGTEEDWNKIAFSEGNDLFGITVHFRGEFVDPPEPADPGEIDNPDEPIVPIGEAALGDADRDGEITAADARLVLRASIGLEEPDPSAADVIGDGRITPADARLILRVAIELEPKLTEPLSPETPPEGKAGAYTVSCSVDYDKVVLTVGAADAAGLRSGVVTINYDDWALEFIKCERNDADMAQFDPDTKRIAFIFLKEQTEPNAEICRITLDASAAIHPGQLPVTVVVNESEGIPMDPGDGAVIELEGPLPYDPETPSEPDTYHCIPEVPTEPDTNHCIPEIPTEVPTEIPTVKPAPEKPVRTDGTKARAMAGRSVAEILTGDLKGGRLLDSEGAEVAADALVASGMKLVAPDGNEFTVIVKGDNDGDGIVGAADARLALRSAVALESLSDWQTDASLVSGEESVTPADARLILRAAVNLEDPDTWFDAA